MGRERIEEGVLHKRGKMYHDTARYDIHRAYIHPSSHRKKKRERERCAHTAPNTWYCFLFNTVCFYCGNRCGICRQATYILSSIARERGIGKQTVETKQKTNIQIQTVEMSPHREAILSSLSSTSGSRGRVPPSPPHQAAQSEECGFNCNSDIATLPLLICFFFPYLSQGSRYRSASLLFFLL